VGTETGETIMSETFICGDHGALVSYLYDECAADERRAMSAHVAICGACAGELVALGATREQLAMWTPPDAQLGFKIVSEAAPPAQAGRRDNVLRPAPWWSRPLPAWAQAAAAAVIFAVGMALGMARSGEAPAAPRNVVQPSAAAAVATKADLVALERQLHAEIAQAHPVSTSVPVAPAAATADARILERVRAMIDDSEQRQQRELALRTAEMVRDFGAQRNEDLSRIERTFGQMDGTTGVEVAQQRQMINYLMRVSQRGQ
jgi:anti-sigma factor RsiW